MLNSQKQTREVNFIFPPCVGRVWQLPISIQKKHMHPKGRNVVEHLDFEKNTFFIFFGIQVACALTAGGILSMEKLLEIIFAIGAYLMLFFINIFT